MKKRKGITKYILILIIIIGIVGYYYYSRYQHLINTPVDPTGTVNISFVIEKGEGATGIAKRLYEKNLILDINAFKIYTRLGGYDQTIVSGRFILDKTQTIPEIINVITNKKARELVLTVPEGSTIPDIDNKLVELEVIEAGQFTEAVNTFDQYDKYPFLEKEIQKDLIHPLEGYLFPDTYFVSAQNFYSENLIQLMLDNFENKIGDDLNNIGERSIHEIVIMASIIEKEVRTTKDIPIVAGILWKRLDNSWLIGADATLLYLKNDRTIDYDDLQEDHPYNTRKNAGLPPGPIGNPGIKSLKASIYPEESDYWYYLTTPDTGEVIYGKTNDEHSYNKRKYLY